MKFTTGKEAPKGSFYKSQVFEPKQITSHDADTIYQCDWKPSIHLWEIRENGRRWEAKNRFDFLEEK